MDEAIAHIDKRLDPFKPHFIREVTREDILKLMEIKMGRILKFNTDKCNATIAQYKEEIAKIDDHLAHIVDYTVDWFMMLKEKYGKNYPRMTEVRNFDTIEATKVVEANEKLYINRAEGFIGTGLKKDEFVCNCSDIDDIILFYRNGTYKVVKVSEKMFVGKDILYLNVFKRNDNRTIYNVIYRDGKVGYNYIKRFAVTGVTRDKEYDITKGTEGSRILYFSISGLLQQPPYQAKVKGLAACNSQTTSPFRCLNNFCSKILSNFLGSLHILPAAWAFFGHRLFLVLQLFMGFLLDNQPCRKAILEMALTFLALGDSVLRPEFLHQRIVLFAEPLG